jgi:hypothetical protein
MEAIIDLTINIRNTNVGPLARPVRVVRAFHGYKRWASCEAGAYFPGISVATNVGPLARPVRIFRVFRWLQTLGLLRGRGAFSGYFGATKVEPLAMPGLRALQGTPAPVEEVAYLLGLMANVPAGK